MDDGDLDTTVVERVSEDQLVAYWRYEQLSSMGFSHEQACILNLWGVDLNDARYLMSRGCPVRFAMTILEPITA